jgi:hypothetical protein
VLLRSLVTVLLASALQPCGARPDAPQRPARPLDTCLGRFRLATPPGLRASSTEYAIYGTLVRGEALAGRAPDEVFEARLAALRADPKVSEVEPFSLPSGLRGATYREGPHTLLVEAFSARGDEGLWLFRDLPEGKLPVAQKLLENIASAWVPAPAGGFCFGRGAIQAVSLSERTRLRLVDDARPELSLEVDTRTVARPAGDELDLEEVRAFAKLTKSTLRVFRDRRRVVAGLPGIERCLATTLPDGRELVRCAFAFPGRARSAEAPRLRLDGLARGTDGAALEAAWDALLDSMEAMPLPPPRPAGPPDAGLDAAEPG